MNIRFSAATAQIANLPKVLQEASDKSAINEGIDALNAEIAQHQRQLSALPDGVELNFHLHTKNPKRDMVQIKTGEGGVGAILVRGNLMGPLKPVKAFFTESIEMTKALLKCSN